MNLATVLDQTASRTPDAVSLHFEGQDTTFGELRDRAGGASALLSAAGVTRGDRIAIFMPNHPSFASALYGIWNLGAVAVPIHAALTAPEVAHVVRDSGAKVMFAEPGHAHAAASLDVSVLDPNVERTERASIADLNEEDLALIQYTAGTSGVPKGAMLTHANLRANLEQMRSTPVAIGADDVVLCVLPLFHIFGLNVVLNLSIDVGAKLVLFERFDPKASADAIRERSVSVVAGAPPAFAAWLATGATKEDFRSVRVAISGAAPLPKEVLNAFDDRFGVTIWEGYGLTETSPALTTTAVGGIAKPGSVGRALPGVEIKLVDEAGDEVEEGDPGEIVVRGPNVFSGYWQRPDETAHVLRDGWFHTGDVGLFDDDGDLYIVDRRRDLVLVSGFNVYPREVEDVLRKHPHVGDVAVVGEPDPETGERVKAFVVPDPPGESVTFEELIEYCKQSLAPYKLPAHIDVVSDIPRNAAGKVLRRALRT